MRTFVLHPHKSSDTRAEDADISLSEAVSLARALSTLELAGRQRIGLRAPQAGTLFGKGKVEELHEKFERDDIDLVIVNGEVTPIQQRNLERAWHVKVLDRTGLILEIFGERAKTREGVLQVDLAHMYYAKSRLVRSWTHLERQRGGGGFLGGPGETQIEADRRALDDTIIRLKRQLSRVVKTRNLHRAARARIPYPIVALVGYTNAGKSTLFNRLTGSEIFAKDMLFATLDPTMRALELPNGKTVILSDTVGFISDLPTQLVAAFRATLEEVLGADLIVHVRDMSHPDTDGQAASVDQVLAELEITDAQAEGMITFGNKRDQLDDVGMSMLDNRFSRDPQAVSGSALTGDGVEEFLALVADRLEPPKEEDVIAMASSDGAARAWLHRRKLVLGEEHDADHMRMHVSWGAQDRAQFLKSFPALMPEKVATGSLD